MKTGITPWDLLLTGVLILASFLALGLLTGETGQTAEVYLDGALYATLSLKEPQTLPLEGIGTVVVRDGGVFVADSTCPDHICQSTGPISRQGQAIFCLPHRLCIRIPSQEVDAVAS